MLSNNRLDPRQGYFHRAHSILSAASVGALSVGCAASGTTAEATEVVMFTDRVHMMMLGDRAAGRALPEPATAPVAPSGALIYHDGKVIQNVQVTQVLYGSGNYIPELTASGGVNMASAYTQMVTSGVFDWLSEYSTASPAQVIGRGSFRSSIQISPAASRNGPTISDASIQSELVAQINAGALPAPDDNQLYMVSFPTGRSVVAPDGSLSCATGGFCAYHGTFKIGMHNVRYGVVPALTGACATGCGGGTAFQNQQAVASHELVGAVTDPDVGLAAVIGSPLAWYDPNFGETGDICNGRQGTYVGLDGNSYTLHLAFSNTARDCILSKTSLRTSDILWRNDSTGEVMEWLMANGRVAGPKIYLSSPPGRQLQGTGDFNGDGTSDILWRSLNTGEVTAWLMANGRLAQPEIRLNAKPGQWQIHGIGDFNGDGTSDLVWRNLTTGEVTEWLMANGNVLGAEIHLYTVPGEWQIQGTGDFNGDGTSDILWRNIDTGEVTEWLMANGQLSQTEIHLSAKPEEWQIQDTGDFNGDGTSDILWRNLSTGEVMEWMILNGRILGAEIPLYTESGEWRIQGAGDFNGDRTSDILWRNANTGEVTEWIMANGQVSVAEFHLFAEPAEWRIQGIGNLDGH
jgi:hypothetical protein